MRGGVKARLRRGSERGPMRSFLSKGLAARMLGMKARLMKLVRERRYDEILALAGEFQGRAGQHGADFEAAADELARTPGVAPALTAIRIRVVTDSGLPPPRYAEALASKLGYSQGLQPLSEASRDASPGSFAERVVAAWTHERVLRSNDVCGEDSLEMFWRRPGILNGELAFLPLRRLASEDRLKHFLHRYGPAVTGHSMPDPPAQVSDFPAAWRAIPPDVEREDASTDRIPACVRGWKSNSNGRIEARVAHFAAPAAHDVDVPVMLASLGLACVGHVAPRDIRVKCASFPSILACLFSAANGGGAYGGGEYGARGRLLAWQSAGALCGRPEDAPETIETEALRCEWFEFDSPGDWFDHIAWDVGVACLRADRKSVAILAATDAD